MDKQILMARLRTDLVAAGFSAAGVGELLGREAALMLDRGLVASALRECDAIINAAIDADIDAHFSAQVPVRMQVPNSDSNTVPNQVALAVIIKLFRTGRAVPRRIVDAALAAITADGLAALGLVRLDGELVVPLKCLEPLPIPATTDIAKDSENEVLTASNIWTIADFSSSITGKPIAPNHVLGIGGASRSLLNWTSRRPVATCLDLGTGCGVQALMCTTHSTRVTATDVDVNALKLADNSAVLSERRIELLAGSLYEPVAGHSFDLICTNPPFVITPAQLRDNGQLTYRDGGMDGDSLCRHVLTQAPTYLNPGGRLFALVNWIVRDDDWQEPIRQWLKPLPTDAWVILRQLQTPAEYAQTWLTDSGLHPGDPEFERGMRAYLDYFDGVSAVALAYVTMRMPECKEPLNGVKHDQILIIEDGRQGIPPEATAADAFWDAVDCLAAVDTSFLECRLVRASDVIEERYLLPGEVDPQMIRLAQRQSLARTVTVDTFTAGFVGAADGELTVRQILTAIAVLMDEDIENVIAQTEPILRDLVLKGFLTFAD